MTKEKKLPKIQKLENEVRVLTASQRFIISAAYRDLEKCGQDRYAASGVTITIKNLNPTNNIIVREVVIPDGLSAETIKALKADVKRAYDTTTNHPISQFPKD